MPQKLMPQSEALALWGVDRDWWKGYADAQLNALEEQALADGCFGLALGLPLHLGLPPFVTGSPLTVKVLTEDMKSLTGGQVIINPDARESADILEQIILDRRSGLNI